MAAKTTSDKDSQADLVSNQRSSFIAVIFLVLSLLPILTAAVELTNNFISHNNKLTINNSSPMLPPPSVLRIAFAVMVSLLISIRGYRKKSLDLSGSITAILVGFFMTLSSTAFFVVLLVFFVTSSMLTKFKSEIKRRIEDDFKEGMKDKCKRTF